MTEAKNVLPQQANGLSPPEPDRNKRDPQERRGGAGQATRPSSKAIWFIYVQSEWGPLYRTTRVMSRLGLGFRCGRKEVESCAVCGGCGLLKMDFLAEGQVEKFPEMFEKLSRNY